MNKLLMMIQNDWQLLEEKVFDHLDYFMKHILKKHNFLMLFSSHPNPSYIYIILKYNLLYVIFCMDLYPKSKIIMLNSHN